jgi:hypothetical protein
MRDDIAHSIDSLMLPIASEMADEDMFGNWGILIHDWAGPETIVNYRNAKDRASFFDAWQEFGRRMNERHPDADPFLGCNQHRDGLYRVVAQTTAPPAAEE